MASEQTPRHSSRLREKSKRKFVMPSRETILDSIEATPYKDLDHLKPRRIINDFLKEHNSYNNRIDLPVLSDDDESLSDFIVDDVTPTSTRHKSRRKKLKEESSHNRRRRVEAVDSDSDLEELLDTSQREKRQSSRIRKQPKKVFHKPDKKDVLNKILEREPDLNDVIDKDDVDDFVEDTDEEDTTSDQDRMSRASSEDEDEDEVKTEGDSKQEVYTGTAGNNNETDDKKVSSHQSVSSVHGTITSALSKQDVLKNSNPTNSMDEKQTEEMENSRDCSGDAVTRDGLSLKDSKSLRRVRAKIEGLQEERNPSSEMCESSEDEFDIRTSKRLRSKVHRRLQQCKALDSGESEEEVNMVFAKRESKRKAYCLTSDEDD